MVKPKPSPHPSSSDNLPSEQEYDIAEPRAESMIHSLRAFGYDLATALADLIDNSIAARAKNVWLDFHWDRAQSTIAIYDDGKGMTGSELLAAMHLGSSSPLVKRDPTDLGRYGLGLKTASFSQARRLTVGTKQGKSVSVRCWDLDYVTRCNKWRVLRNGSEAFAARALPRLSQMEHGTVVFWESMDRLTPEGTDTSSGKAQDQFYQHADHVKAHLAMVFHRFLDPRENVGRTALKIWINNNPVAAWDPFLTTEKATQLLTEEAVPRQDIRDEIAPTANVVVAFKETYDLLVGAGVTPSYALFRLLNMEPFNRFSVAIAALAVPDMVASA